MSEDGKTVTVWQRKRRTSMRVKISDVCARGLITAGGMGTIAAVAGVAVFSVWVAAPLLFSGQVTGKHSYERAWDNPSPNQPLHIAIDDHRLGGW